MLAVNLIDRLKALIIYENNSININTGNEAIGHFGIKIFKNFKLLYNKPNKKIALHVDNDNHMLTIR